MSSNEEIEDYMSDTFIAQDANDIRPSLLFSHSSKVKHESMKKKSKSDPKPKSYYQELEKKLREEALNRPLDMNNKGFELLTKMGFKSTKTDDKGDQKLSEPLKIELKNDRKGLGSEKSSSNKRLKVSDHKINDKIREENFLNHKRNENQLFLIEKDLKNCQKACQTLDLESGTDENHPKWFWPQIRSDNESEDDSNQEDCEDGEELSLEQKLKIINEYLRQKYFYCIWCGIKFSDSNDINENCSGDTRDKHEL